MFICSLVPYKSTFVDNPEDVNEAENKYLVNERVDERFPIWKFCLMKMLIDISKEDVPVPEDVKLHTKRYLDKENVIKQFVENNIVETGNNSDILTLTESYNIYKEFCKEEGHSILKKCIFHEDLKLELDGSKYRGSSNGLKNVWRGYKLVTPNSCDYSETDGLPD